MDAAGIGHANVAHAHEDDNDELSVVVNTWHVARFIGRPPEGLPTELLSDYSSVFLFFDHVYCDWSGLRGELKWAGRWISADIYLWLREAGIIKPISLNNYLPSGFWSELFRIGYTQQVIDVMGEELLRIQDANGTPRRLDARLSQANHDIFMHVQKPNALLYDYEGGLFIPNSSRRRRKKIERIMDISTPDTRRRLQQSRRLLRALSTVLKYPGLLPPIELSARGSFQENTAAEKRSLYGVILGNPKIDHERFRDERLSGQFVRNDWKVDSDPRRLAARQNVERLLEIKRQTRAIRADLRELLRSIAFGQTRVTDVWRDFSTQMEQFLALCPPSHQLLDRAIGHRLAMSGTAALELFLALADFEARPSPLDLHESTLSRRQDLLTQLPKLFPLVTFDQIVERVPGARFTRAATQWLGSLRA
jgi:hypothetical protein